MTPFNPNRPGTVRRIALAAGILGGLVGAGHLVAWMSGAMAQVRVSTIVMKANAGLSLLVSGLALILVVAPDPGAGRRRSAQACAAFVLFLGLATLSEHVVGWDLGIDQLLATEAVGAAATASPNRMGPPACVSFILLGIALLSLTRRRDAGRRRALHDRFAVIVALLGLLSIIGYVYDADELYDIARLTAIAWSTALSLVVLAIGVLCARPGEGLIARVTADDPGSAMVRALLGPMILLPIALGWARLTGERRGWFDAAMGTGLMMLVFIVTFSFLLLFASRRVSLSSAALHESERETRSQKDLLAVTLGSIGDGVIVADAGGAVTYLNAEAARLTGWTHDDARGRPLAEVFAIVSEQTRERVEDPVGRVLRARDVIARGEHALLLARNGREIPVDQSGARISDVGDAARGVVLVFRDISDRRRAEQEQQRLLADVQAQKDKLGALVNSMRDEIWFCDTEKRFTLENRAALTEFQLAAHQAIDVEEFAATLEVLRPDGSPRSLEEAPPLRALKGEAVIDQEEIIRTPATGELRHRQVSATPVRDGSGNIIGSVSVVRDITDRKRAEAALRESEASLADAQRIAHLGSWEWDVAPDRLTWSKETFRLLGCEPASVVPTHDRFLALVHPDDRPNVTRAIADALARRQPYDLDFRFLRSDGSVCWVHSSGEVAFDPAGNAVRVTGVVLDISERKQADEALRRSEERFRALTSASSQVLYLMSPDWSEMRELQGGDFMADIRKANSDWLKDYVHPDDHGVVLAAIREAVRTGSIFELEHRVLRVDGTSGWTYSRAVPVRNAAGEVVEWFGAASDISGRKRAEEELHEANVTLAEADQRKDEFIAILSHELRNPLAPIRYALPLLERERLSESSARAVAVITRQADHLTRLVDDLLDISRITAGRIELRREDVTLDSVLAAATEAASPAILAGRHTLTTTIADEPIWIRADPARIAQVITNLLKNSATYTPPGGRITLEAARSDGQAVIRVRDNGMGIAPDALPTVFDMFRQVSRADRPQGGLGIGLALARRLVDMHGGSIEGYSAGVDQGSEFIVRLPALSEASTRTPMASAGSTSVKGRRLKVLVVDDNADLVEMLATVVRCAGHDVRQAMDGPSALSEAISYGPDVVFLDIGMPVMSGLEVARELRRRPEMVNVRLVALTGWGQAKDRRRTEDAGFDLHLTKPTEPQQLQDLLARLANEPAV